MKKQTRHLLMLLLAAFLWGTTFVAQSLGAELVGPFTYLMGRSWIAVVVLLPVIAVRARAAARNGKHIGLLVHDRRNALGAGDGFGNGYDQVGHFDKLNEDLGHIVVKSDHLTLRQRTAVNALGAELKQQNAGQIYNNVGQRVEQTRNAARHDLSL